MSQQELASGYNEKYLTPNFFRDRRWLYSPFVKALIRHAGLKSGARLLDAGCGQGLFTSLFAENGLEAVGVDISEVGVSSATKAHEASGAKFRCADIRWLRWENEFDCVFTRSCSLYNTNLIETDLEITEILLSQLRSRGILIFDYHTKLNPRRHSDEWIYHSLSNIRAHFARYAGAEVYFSIRVERMLLPWGGFTARSSHFSTWVSRLTGLGGELLAFIRKE